VIYSKLFRDRSSQKNGMLARFLR